MVLQVRFSLALLLTMNQARIALAAGQHCLFPRAVLQQGLFTSAFITSSPSRSLRSASSKSKKNSTPQPYELNINDALKKEDEDLLFSELLEKSVSTLQGVGPVHMEQMESLKLKTIRDLAQYKYFHLARSLYTLSLVEQDGKRSTTSVQNVNKGVDKAYERQSLKQVAAAPTAALQGLSDTAGETLNKLGVRTVADLAQWKYCLRAEALQVAAQYEENISTESTKSEE